MHVACIGGDTYRVSVILDLENRKVSLPVRREKEIELPSIHRLRHRETFRKSKNEWWVEWVITSNNDDTP